MGISKTLRPRLVPPPLGPGKMVFVNAYEVSRHFGGPEEGGWYYDVGTPLASVPVWLLDSDVEESYVEATKTYLFGLFYHDYVGRRDRYSVIGEEDLIIAVEDRLATPWPDKVPHYE